MEKEEQGKREQTIDWAGLMRRKQRPLPHWGCSAAFYALIVIIAVCAAIAYLQYRQQ